MKLVSNTFLSLLATLILLGSCSKFQRLQRSDSVDERYNGAVAYYEEKDYYRASVLLEGLMPYVVGSEKAEHVQFYYANCSYQEKDLYTAAHYFKRFYTTYPRSEHTEEAMFLYAKCLYGMSPKSNLDQDNTLQALQALQTYQLKYPSSPRVEECQRMIDELEDKLELKAYEQAKLHNQLRNYRAMVISAQNFSKRYPNSKYNEELDFLKLQAQYDFARKSIEQIIKDGKVVYLKKERLQDAKKFYYDFLSSYPNSSYMPQAESIYKQIESALTAN